MTNPGSEKALREDAKRAQDALAQREALAHQQFAELDLLYRSLPIALAVFDRDMRFLRVNDQLSRVAGVPAAAHTGLTLREAAPACPKLVEGLLQKSFETVKPMLTFQLRAFL